MADDNPFDAPLASEVDEHQQAQAATAQSSDNGNPFSEPLMSEKAEVVEQARPSAPIKPVTTSTNPKLAAAEAAKDMPEYVGATGAAAAGTFLASEAAAPALRFIAHEYGAPAVKAIEEAAQAHPIVAKLIGHALADTGTLAVAKWLKLFGSEK